MKLNDYSKSDLEKWLRKKHMATKEFVDMVGCSRAVIYYVKNDWTICPRFAKKIIEITNGEVVPKFNISREKE